MESSEKVLLIRGTKLFHFSLSILLFALTWSIYLRQYHIHIPGRYNLFVYAFYAVVFFFFCRIYNAYLIEYSRILDIAFSLSLSSTISIVIAYGITLLAWNKFYSPLYFLLLLLAQSLLNALWAFLTNRLYYATHAPLSTIVIYRNRQDLCRLDNVKRFYKKYRVEKYLENPQTYEEAIQSIGDCKVVFLAGVDATVRNGVVKYCAEHGIIGFFLPHVGDIIMMGGQHIQAFTVPIMGITGCRNYPEYLYTKRIFDILFSLVFIVITSPIMLLTALAIHLYDGGPVLYKQVRLTKGGKEFRILKFRSMRTDAEKDGIARLSTGEHDDRITPVGRIIRSVRLDELPQLFNILKGDMSVVGPRPERPEIARQYSQSMPAFSLRLQAKAGLTGYAQIYGKYNTDPYDKLEMDLIYINKMNLLLDIQLIFATVRVLFLKESTSGIAEDHTTALDEGEK